jgi:hypothetical protein
VNETIQKQAGIVVLGEGKGYTTLSKAQLKNLNVKLKINPGDTVSFTINKNTSEFRFGIPF